MADDDELSRRELLKQTGATLSVLALAGACSGDDTPADGAGAGSPGGAGGSGAGAGAGSSSGTGGGSAGAAGEGSGASGAAGGGTGGSAPSAGSGGNPEPDGGAAASDAGGGDTRVVVAVVRDADLDAAVARAVELAGGIDAIQPGQTVFIKPNAVSDRAIGTPGIRTSNAVLAAVIRLVKARDPGRIIVGDRSARDFDSQQVFENAGIAEAAMAAGADEVYAAPSPLDDPDAWMLVQPPDWETSWQSAGGLLAMRRILEADHLINVPACKNHRFALFSMSMKNFIGAVGDSTRNPLHFAETISSDFTPIGRDIAVLNQPFTPLINIIDATTALINGGPQGDTAEAVRASPGLIIASHDRIAADALGVALIKLELGRNDVAQPDASQDTLTTTRIWQLPQIVEGSARGLGVAGPDGVRLEFADVPDAAALEELFRS